MPAKSSTFGFPTRSVSEVSRPRSWAIYGRSGSGKTTFSGTFPGPILLLDISDRGTDSIKDAKNIQIAEPEVWEDFDDIYDELKRNPKAFKTVVFDTITQMQDMARVHVLEKNKKKVQAAADWGTMTRREWGDVAAMMKERITNFRNLPIETVFLAQERLRSNDEDEASAELLTPEVGPALSPSVASHLNASVSIIANTFIRVRRKVITKNNKKTESEEISHWLRLAPHPVYTTKVRKPVTISVEDIQNPTYKDVIDSLEGK